MALFAESPRITTVCPVCSKCGAPMWLFRIEPDKPGFALRSFECPRCQYQMTEVIEIGTAVLAGAGPAPLARRGWRPHRDAGRIQRTNS